MSPESGRKSVQQADPVHRVLQSAKDLLFGETEDAAGFGTMPDAEPASSGGQALDHAQPGTTESGSNMLQVLSGLLRSGVTRRAGSLQLLGLNAIRERLGARWDAAAIKVHRIATGVLKAHLKPGDVFARADDETYVILFADLGQAEAEFKARVLADEIGRTLCGEVPEGDTIVVRSLVANIDGQVDLKSIGSVRDLAEVVRTKTTAPDEAENGDGSAAAHPAARPPELMAGVGDRTVADALRGCAVRFQPVWNVRQQVISGYRAAMVDNHSGRPVTASDDPYLAQGNRLGLALDCLTLRAATAGVKQMLDAGHKSVVVVRVQYDTLATTRQRQMYFKIMQEIPPAFLPLITAILVGTPLGAPRGRLVEMVGVLKRFCRSVALHLPLDYRLVNSATGIGCFGVATQVGAESKDMRSAFGEYCAFVQRAKLNGLSTSIVGADSIGAVSAAVNAGFNYVAGDPIGKFQSKPGETHLFNPEQLYG